MMETDWQRIREEFPALANWTFLNTAAFGQLPRRATEAVVRHFAHRDELACSDFLSWFDDADRTRGLIARLINCQPDDIAFIPNASFALSLLFGSINWRPGDRAVTLMNEFPNNIYNPARLPRDLVEFVETPWERFYEAVNERTRVVAISSVNYTNGFRPPLEEISRYLRERGVLFYVDGTQSVGALEFDVGAVQPDLLAVHGYKWLLSPNGAAFMYVSPKLREWMPPSVIGWRSHHAWRNVDCLHHGSPELTGKAEKYEGGMLNFSALYGMTAAIEMILEIGPAAIERRVLDLAAKASGRLRTAGAEILHSGSPILAARWDGRDVSRLTQRLAERRILVSARHGNLRVSVHLYNNEEDLERLSEGLK